MSVSNIETSSPERRQTEAPLPSPSKPRSALKSPLPKTKGKQSEEIGINLSQRTLTSVSQASQRSVKFDQVNYSLCIRLNSTLSCRWTMIKSSPAFKRPMRIFEEVERAVMKANACQSRRVDDIVSIRAHFPRRQTQLDNCRIHPPKRTRNSINRVGILLKADNVSLIQQQI